MATVTEKRAWLRDQGHDVPDRGRLRPELLAVWDQGHADPEDQGITEADFSGLEDEVEPSVPMRPETPPARPTEPRTHVRARLFGPHRNKTTADAKSKAKGKKPSRISTEHLITRVWEGLARLATPLSMPVATTLTLQSPVAGMVLEDIVKGTVVDRALQPIARAEEKAEAALALIAPPLIVAAIEQAQALPPQQQMIRMALLMPMLDESLRIWLKVAGPKVEEAAKREAEYQEKYGATITSLKAAIFGQVTVQAEPEMAAAAA